MSQLWKALVYLLLAFGAMIIGPGLAERWVVGFDGGDVMILVQQEYYEMLLRLIAPLFLIGIFTTFYKTYPLLVVYPILWIGVMVLQHKVFDIMYLSVTQEGAWLYAIILMITGFAAVIALWKTSFDMEDNSISLTLRIVAGLIFLQVTIGNPIFAWDITDWFIMNGLVLILAIVGVVFTFGQYLLTAYLVSQLFPDERPVSNAQE